MIRGIVFVSITCFLMLPFTPCASLNFNERGEDARPKCWKFMFLDFLDYLTCWMFVETPLCFQFNLQDAVGPCFKVLLNVDKKRVVRRWGIWPSKPFCKYALQASFSDTLNNKRRNKQTNKQTNKQPNKQASKQASKQTSKQAMKRRKQGTQASKQASRQASKQASKQASTQASKQASPFFLVWVT